MTDYFVPPPPPPPALGPPPPWAGTAPDPHAAPWLQPWPARPPSRGRAWVIALSGVLAVVLLGGVVAAAVLAADNGRSGSGSGTGTGLTVGTPSGDEYGFTVPDGFKHDKSGDDQGTVSATSSFGDPPYIDVYTDRTTASAKGALPTVAADLRRDEAAHGGNLDAGTRSRTVSGHDVVEWTGSFPKDDANDPATMVTAVVLIGSDSMEIDYSDDPDSFEFDSAEQAINTVVASLHRR